MKVALIVPGFSRHERDWCIPALLDFVRVLAADVDLHLFPTRWPETDDTYRVFNATVHGLGGGRRLGWGAIALWRRAIQSIAAEHRRGAFDLVHAFWVDEPAWLAVWAARRLEVPAIASVAGGELVSMRDIDYGLARLRGRRRATRWVLRRADRVTVGSRYLLTSVMAEVPTAVWAKLKVAPLGVDTGRFRPDGARRPSSGRPVIVTVGSLQPVKGQRLLLDAVRQIAMAELWVVGDGPDRAALETTARRFGLATRVRFLGAVPHDKLPAIYRSAELFVQASRHESQGMAVLEAAASGVAVVGTPVGVLPELGGVARTAGELARLMTELLENDDRRRAAALAACSHVRREMSVEAATARFCREYERLAGACPQAETRAGTRLVSTTAGWRDPSGS